MIDIVAIICKKNKEEVEKIYRSRIEKQQKELHSKSISYEQQAKKKSILDFIVS